MEEIRLKLTLDGKEALATLSLTDEELKTIAHSIHKVSEENKDTAKEFANWGMIVTGLRESVEAVKEVFSKLSVMAKESAELEVLKENFRGTAENLEMFKKATAETVSEANLIKLSNQATDLGLTLEQQIILFSLAEDASEKYGGGVEANFMKIVSASEGATRGLKSLGIQKEVYEQTVKELASAQGTTIDKLDAESQKQIRLEAILKASGITLEDVTNKTKDSADKLESFSVKVEEARIKVGNLIKDGLIVLSDTLEKTGGAGQTVFNTFAGLGGVFMDILPVLASVKLAFGGITKAGMLMGTAIAGAFTDVMLFMKMLEARATLINAQINAMATQQNYQSNKFDYLAETMGKNKTQLQQGINQLEKWIEVDKKRFGQTANSELNNQISKDLQYNTQLLEAYKTRLSTLKEEGKEKENNLTTTKNTVSEVKKLKDEYISLYNIENAMADFLSKSQPNLREWRREQEFNREQAILNREAKEKENIGEKTSSVAELSDFDKWNELINLTGSLNEGINSLWDNFIIRSRQAKDEWDAVWLAMRNSALKRLGEILVSQITNSIFSIGAKLLGGIIGIATGNPFLMAGAVGAIPMANGGVITKPSLVYAGESGHEAFVPLNKIDSLLINSNLRNSYANNPIVNVNVINDQPIQVNGELGFEMDNLRVKLNKIENDIAKYRVK